MIGSSLSYLLVTAAAVLVYAGNGVLCAPLCLTGDFDSQLQLILHTQVIPMQDAAEIISQVLEDVQTTLNKRWQGFKLIPNGSLLIGLGTKTSSDIDICLLLPNYNSSADLYVVQEAEALFMKQPALYSNMQSVIKPRYARFSFLHIPSQRAVDIVFRNGITSVYNSNTVQYYLNLDKRFLPLAHILKYWFRVHGLVQHLADTLQNYGLYLLIIFYLQQKNMAPPAYVLQADSKSYFVDIWDMGFNELPYTSTNTEDIYQLLGGFYKYYSEFNFEEYIIALYIGRPIPRNAFMDIDNFPKEYSLYNSTLKHARRVAIQNDFNINTAICIQDAFEHSLNVVQQTSHEWMTKFKYLMKSTTIMFEHLPRDSILKAILATKQLKASVGKDNDATVEVLNEQDCIEVIY